MVSRLVVLGASGDLMARYLGPALLALEQRGHLPDRLSIIGAARQPWSDQALCAHVASGLPATDDRDAPARRRLLDRLRYRRVDVTVEADLRPLVDGAPGPVVAYLALPPQIAAEAVENLARIELPARSRIVLDKPFGDDLASARALNQRIARCFDDDHVFRVDHFLGMRTVRNLLALRFANPLLAACWSAPHVERIEIIWDEVLGLEGRAGYYDGVGALKDMVQSHLLQVLCLLAMEPPTSLDPCDLRARRTEVLRAIRRMSPEAAGAASVRARYGAGARDGQAIGGYVSEDGVDPDQQTETFVELVLQVDSPRWRGVPFRLRTGKALARARHEVQVVFKAAASGLFADEAPGLLRIGLDPDRLGLRLDIVDDDLRAPLHATELERSLPGDPLPAYARVLASILDGDATVSVGGDEAEEAWRVVEPFLTAWHHGLAPLREYPAGSDGPEPVAATAHQGPSARGDRHDAEQPTH